MTQDRIILASTSQIRAKLLRAAGMVAELVAPRVDEQAIMGAMLAEGAQARDLADVLAEAKAKKVSSLHPDALVLGCDQTLDIGGVILSKPESPEQALQHLQMMQGETHHLYSAAVIYQGGAPQWRHVGHARMTMRPLSTQMLQGYVAQNWPAIGQAVGCYKIEEIGAQLFSAIEGDNFTIQGLPLIPLVNYLVQRGVIAT